MSEARIERIVTAGPVTVGRGADVPPATVVLENNVWLIGDDDEVLVVDAAHDAQAIARGVGDREALGILLTHGHGDHINAAVEAAELLDTHIYLHPGDLFLWQAYYDEELPDFELADGATFFAAGVEFATVHTPGHTPGSVCFVAPALGTVFSGDTLFRGGPGATRWDYSSFDQIIESIRTRLLPLPESTLVRPGHGENTIMGEEAADLKDWISRGW